MKRSARAILVSKILKVRLRREGYLEFRWKEAEPSFVNDMIDQSYGVLA